MRKLMLVLTALIFLIPTVRAESEGNYLYRVTTVRATPGTLAELLDGIKVVMASAYYENTGQPTPLVMRHSQGDQWDLLFITPMNSWVAFYDDAAIEKRTNAGLEITQKLHGLSSLLAFSEDHFAFGPSFEIIEKAYNENSFFHIEMFEAAAGKSAELMQQRRMENAYLKSTEQTENMIFYRAAGSNVDVFTIGFHKSLQTFAAPANVTDAEKEAAAKSAGFKGLADISYYLRSLISGHHDTLAVKAP